MPPKELPDSAPGKYVPYHPNPYYSPEALPVEPKLELSEQMALVNRHTAVDFTVSRLA